MNDLNEMFFQECDDLLEGLSSGLNELESGGGDDEIINGMFRAVHSIKGGAGAFGLEPLIEFTHAFENILDDVRAGRLATDESVVALLFTASDHLSDLVDAARNEEQLPPEQGASILSDLKHMSGALDTGSTAREDGEEDEPPAFEPTTLTLDGDLPALDDMLSPIEPARLTITFKALPQLYANGHDPALLFRSLQDLGNLSVKADLSSVCPLRDAPWSTPALSWTIEIVPDDSVDEAAIREVFEFVEGLCELEISSHAAAPESDALPPLGKNTGGSETGATSRQSDPHQARETAAKPAPNSKKPPAARSSTIRVDLQRVDQLINLVGELVIAEAMLRQSMDEMPHSANGRVDEAMNQLKQLSGAIQESVMAIRAQPVRGLFQRMSRIVRETSKEAGKSAQLITIGDATEVDKTVTERLVEPLTHMIRNAIDHGLETPDKRLAANKDKRGTVTLEAAHRSGRVVITLSDDGGGIDRPKVRQIAEEKGLIRPDDDLADTDIDNLLFKPGFSTVTEVSNLSGRGVGMDVVRNEIQSLGGRVSMQSEPGKGTSVTISLPLTLAVLEGMVVRVADQTLIVPTLSLREMLQPGQARIHTLCDGDRVLALNDELVPIINLGAALGYRTGPACLDKQSLLLIEDDAGRRSVLAVDAIAEQREVVIKGLEQSYQSISGIAAATILGNGRIALIIDTDQVIALPATMGAAEQLAPNATGEVLNA